MNHSARAMLATLLVLVFGVVLVCIGACSSKPIPPAPHDPHAPHTSHSSPLTGSLRYFELKDSAFKGDLGFAIADRAGPISDETILREGTFYRDASECLRAATQSTAIAAPTPPHATEGLYEGALFRERPAPAPASPASKESPQARPLHAPKGVFIVAIDGFEHENVGFILGMRNKATTDDDDLRSAIYFRSEDELVQLLDDHGVPPEETIIMDHMNCFHRSTLTGFERDALPKVRAR